MLFTLVFILWTGSLAAAWFATRTTALATFGMALIISFALFLHHMTDPLTLSF